jgi:hypothetical protein
MSDIVNIFNLSMHNLWYMYSAVLIGHYLSIDWNSPADKYKFAPKILKRGIF